MSFLASPCLRWDLLIIFVYAKLVGPQTSGNSPDSVSHPATGAGITGCQGNQPDVVSGATQVLTFV